MAEFLQGFQVGSSAMGQSMNRRSQEQQSALDRDLRYQELKSQDALRRVQERAAAQTMTLQLEAHQKQIQFGADMQKALAATQMETSSIIPMPTPMGTLPMPNPSQQDPSLSMVRNVGEVIAKYQPEKYTDFVTDVALRRAQMEREKRMTSQVGVARPLAPETANLTNEKINTEKARQKELGARAARGPTAYAPTDTIKNLAALAEAEKKGDQNAVQALRNQLKLDGLGEMDVIKFRSELRGLENEALISPEEKEKRRQAIYDKYDKLAGSRKSNAPATLPAVSAERLIKVRKPNGQTGTVPFSRLKEIPSDWESELDEK